MLVSVPEAIVALVATWTNQDLPGLGTWFVVGLVSQTAINTMTLSIEGQTVCFQAAIPAAVFIPVEPIKLGAGKILLQGSGTVAGGVGATGLSLILSPTKTRRTS